ncbi:hypothetical protein ABZX39_32235 [Streptomyces collinus]|uniref:hypothetical protein n=1 Tax=Streptomyces collinus TaxID=42684 RepID=UPI0033AEB305
MLAYATSRHLPLFRLLKVKVVAASAGVAARQRRTAAEVTAATRFSEGIRITFVLQDGDVGGRVVPLSWLTRLAFGASPLNTKKFVAPQEFAESELLWQQAEFGQICITPACLLNLTGTRPPAPRSDTRPALGHPSEGAGPFAAPHQPSRPGVGHVVARLTASGATVHHTGPEQRSSKRSRAPAPATPDTLHEGQPMYAPLLTITLPVLMLALILGAAVG